MDFTEVNRKVYLQVEPAESTFSAHVYYPQVTRRADQEPNPFKYCINTAADHKHGPQIIGSGLWYFMNTCSGLISKSQNKMEQAIHLI